MTIKSKNQTIAAMAGAMILISAASLFAQDWPQWRGPNRDDKVSGFKSPEKWPSELKQEWKTTVGSGDATPALVGGKLYVFARQGEDEVILCLDAKDGKELWQNKYPAPAVSGAARSHPGPRSSPAVANGKVVTLGVGGTLSCLEASSGKVLWRKDEFPKMTPRFFTATSPLVVDEKVIAHLGGTGDAAVIAFDLASGEPRWKWTGEGPAYSSPVLMTVEGAKQVVVQTEKSLLGLAPENGKLLWQVPTPIQGRAYSAATPIIDDQTVIYTGQGRGTKAIKISKEADGFTAKEVWSNDQLGTTYNTPVLKDGFLFGLSDRANFYCMNAATGQTAWTDSTKRENFGAILDAGSVILAMPSNSELVVFKPNEKQYEELAKIKLSATPVYAHPIASGNTLYVKDNDAVTQWLIQ